MNQTDLPALFALALILCGLALTLWALVTFCELVFANLTARARIVVERMPRRAIALGAINALFFGVLIIAGGSSDEGGQGFALLLLTGILSLAAVGLAAITRSLGDRLLPERGSHLRHAAGTGLLCLAALTPIVGWFAVAPLALLAALGAAIIAIFWRGPRPATPASDT